MCKKNACKVSTLQAFFCSIAFIALLCFLSYNDTAKGELVTAIVLFVIL